MKKSSIILIAVIYVCAIVLVSFFGLNYKEFNKVVYASSVEVINTPDNYVYDQATGEQIKVYMVKKDANTGLRQFQIEWRIEPADSVTNKNVRFIYSDDSRYEVSSTGLVTFSTGGVSVTITVVPDDNSDCYDKIMIFCF